MQQQQASGPTVAQVRIPPTRFYLNGREVTGIRGVGFNQVEAVAVDDRDYPIRGTITYLAEDVPMRKFWRVAMEEQQKTGGFELQCEPPAGLGPPILIKQLWIESFGYVIQLGSLPIVQVRFKAMEMDDLPDMDQEKAVSVDIMARLQAIWDKVQERVGQIEAEFAEVASQLVLAGELDRELVVTLPKAAGTDSLDFEKLRNVIIWAVEEVYGYRFRVHVFWEEEHLERIREIVAQRSRQN